MWVQFIVSAGVIIFAGTKLTAYADLFSDRLRLGKAWVGIILLALITSLPEAVTSLAAVVSLDATDLAIGNLLGSNNINLMIVVIMDLLVIEGSVTNKIKLNQTHCLSALIAICLSVVVFLEILLSSKGSTWAIGNVSLGVLAIALVYLAGVRHLARIQADDYPLYFHPPEEHLKSKARGKKIYMSLVLYSVLVIAGSVWLANTGDLIAQRTGLGRTFVGSIFLAFTTSLPEIVVSVSALRMGSFDMAFGNIFGSNMFNIFIVFFCGICYTKRPILSAVSLTHLITIGLTLLLTGIVLLGVRSDKKKGILHLGWDSIVMIILFLAGTGLLYRLR